MDIAQIVEEKKFILQFFCYYARYRTKDFSGPLPSK